MNTSAPVRSKPHGAFSEVRFQNLTVHFESSTGTVWCYMNPRGRATFSPDLLAEMTQLQSLIARVAGHAQSFPNEAPLRFQVLASRTPGVFSFGGDLDLFARLVRSADRRALWAYMKACVDMLYPSASGYGKGVATISLVQGDALGGGFEAALAADRIIAERGARLGFPERLFNMFPGMGAFSFLCRRIEPNKARRIIESARNYRAEELLDLGVIDQVVEPGAGEDAVRDYIANYQRYAVSYSAMDRVRRTLHPIDCEELMQVGEIWVEAALRITDRDLRMMERLVKSQTGRVENRSVSSL